MQALQHRLQTVVTIETLGDGQIAFRHPDRLQRRRHGGLVGDEQHLAGRPRFDPGLKSNVVAGKHRSAPVRPQATAQATARPRRQQYPAG